ncbi:hypothetical protein WOLCODRAFT_159637 [Wolfiporia cocos MD-104 SS10]|uniref:Uncharacterized protein n=1 Tax=Wolfiporia cocos (strain MD-104) TaxID=742152 RepID=A0A2H3JBF9_WOLCO|nr:hypothetical protein WOLCODRAFT_159637 [Wolfiporia cocos MD-104 SS10]
MLAQRGSRPDDKSQRSVQVRAPIQAQLKSPTWGSEEDDGPTAHPTRRKREVTQHLPGRRPCNQPRTAAPTALPTAPLDWTTPSSTLPRTPTRKGGPTCGGSPLRPRPSSGQRRKHLGSQRNGAHRPPWTRRGPPALLRTNNQAPPSIIDPSRNPARAIIERGAASARAIAAAHALGREGPKGHGTPESIRAPRRTPPAATTEAHQSGRPYGKGNRPSLYRHSRKPQPSTPQRIKRKGGPRRIIAKATRRAPTSNGSADCLNNRTTPSAGRVNQRRAAGKPQGSEEARGAEHTNTSLGPTACRTIGNGQAPRTGQSPPSKAYPGTVRTRNSTGIQAQRL